MQHLKEIFQMQHDLNKIIGRDTVNAPEQQRHDWMFGYLFAAAAEANELLECFDHDTFSLMERGNSLIEIIDIWHFISSACHLVGITSDDIVIENTSVLNHKFNEVLKFSIKLDKTITSNIAFKWWSADVKADPSRQFRSIYDVEKLKKDLIELFSDLINISYLFGMLDDQILIIYREKWQKNVDRQRDNYDVRTKTEADNLEIEKRLDNIMQSCHDRMENNHKESHTEVMRDTAQLLLKAPDDRLLCDNVIRTGITVNLFDLSYNKSAVGSDVTSIIGDNIHIRNVYFKFSDCIEIRSPIELEEPIYFLTECNMSSDNSNIRYFNKKCLCQLNNIAQNIYGDTDVIFKVLPKEATFYVYFTIYGKIDIKTSDIRVDGVIDDVSLPANLLVDNQHGKDLINLMAATQMVELAGYDLYDKAHNTITTNNLNKLTDDKIKMMASIRSV